MRSQQQRRRGRQARRQSPDARRHRSSSLYPPTDQLIADRQSALSREILDIPVGGVVICVGIDFDRVSSITRLSDHRRGFVALGLDQDLESLTFAVDSTPHVHLPSSD